MREVFAIPGNKIFLGRCGENMAACVIFSLVEWQALYGEGTPQLIHQRNGDKTPHPCVLEQVDGAVIWNITNADVAVAGRGRAELQYFVGNALVKSETYTTITERALGAASETPPEPYQSWVDNVLGAAVNAHRDADNAAASAEAAKESEEASAESETNAKLSEINAKRSETKANEYMDEACSAAAVAVDNRDSAVLAANVASESRNAAAASATAAATSATNALSSENLAGGYMQDAKLAAADAEKNAKLAAEGAETVAKSGAVYVLDEDETVEDAPEWANLVVDPDEDAVAPDWNQNDPAAADYIKNRPFCEMDGEVVLLPETVVEIGGEMDTALVGVPLDLVLGETYTVNWNGVDYECVAEASEEDLVFRVLAADPFYIEQDIELPYFIVYGEPGLVTLRISQSVVDVKKLDSKYLDLDAEPVPGSGNPVASGGVAEAIRIVKEIAESVKPGESPDWNAGIGETGHIKNRPFYEGEVETELVHETVLEFKSDMWTDKVTVDFNLVAGETYVVTWDGVNYECVAEHDGEAATTYLSNEPFYIEQEDGDAYLTVYGEDASISTVTMSIAQITTGIKKLDNKYLDLTTFELTATFADGTTQRFAMLGEAVVE